MGSLKKQDNTYTKTDAETCEVLLATHFPGFIATDDVEWEETSHAASDVDWNIAQDVVTNDKVTWALNSFQTFKSPGIDGIFPGLLKWSSGVVPHLVQLYRACLAHRYTPKQWRETKVVFIPKPGRSDYTQAKSYRPISLTSFLLKTLERLCDWEIRNGALKCKPLHRQQHAFSPGKSTESALHDVVTRIESSLSSKQTTIGVFIDVEGAFDKTTFTSISRALSRHGINDTISGWIENMLQFRAVRYTVNTTTRGVVCRGCPQGGVLSPLLWNIVVDELLCRLNDSGYYTVGYADDLAILLNGPFESVLCNLMRSALVIVEAWCAEHELSVNPTKTELVLFTNKRKLPELTLPKLLGAQLVRATQVKYLGITLDSKLLWNIHIEQKLNKACIIFWQCKRLIGQTWGLSPKITLWLYTAVIRPILTYGAVVWWPRTDLTTVKNQLRQLQRHACMAITGSMRTTPTAAIEVLLGLLPLDLHVQQEAKVAAVRLRNAGLWNNNRGIHTKILDRAIAHHPLIEAPYDRIPMKRIFDRKYLIQMYETKSDQSGINEVRIYTDGSKMSSGTGAGVYSLDLNIKISTALGTNSSIFQCECVAIIEAAQAVLRRNVTQYNIRILTDSASVLQALSSFKINSGLIYVCHKTLEEVALCNNLVLQWIKGHSGSLGNDVADELARRGSNNLPFGPEPMLPVTTNQLRSWIREWAREQHQVQWANTSDCRQSREALPEPSKKLSRHLLNLRRDDLRTLVGTLTGHCPLNKHLHVLGITDSPLCRACIEQEETVAHVVLECVGLTTQRTQILGTPRSLREACENPRKLLRFWTELGWMR